MDWILFTTEHVLAPLLVAFIIFICRAIYLNKKLHKRVKKTFFIKIVDQNLNQFYNEGLLKEAMTIVRDDSIERMTSFEIKINDKTARYLQNVGWIGYAVRTLPMKDFKPLIKNDYSIKLNVSHTNDLGSFYIELKSSTKEVIKKEIELKRKSQDIELRLSDFVIDAKYWEDIYELCIVIISEKYQKSISDELTIKNLRLEKH